MPGTSMNIGIVGPGEVADRFHAPAIAEAATLWSVVGRTQPSAAAFAAKHGAKSSRPAHAFEELPAFLADRELDTVLVATPDWLHIPIALAAAKAGKHLLIEKPLAHSAAQLPELRSVLELHGVRCAVGYHLRHHPGHRKLREAIRSGKLGALQDLRIHWTYDRQDRTDWRNDSTESRWWSMAALGTHCVDLARWLITDEPAPHVDVLAFASDHRKHGRNDEAALLVLRIAGVRVAITTSVLYRSPFQVDVYGQTGSAHATWTLGPRGTGTIALLGEPLLFEPRNPYTEQILALREWISGASPRVATCEEGIWNVELLERLRPL